MCFRARESRASVPRRLIRPALILLIGILGVAWAALVDDVLVGLRAPVERRGSWTAALAPAVVEVLLLGFVFVVARRLSRTHQPLPTRHVDAETGLSQPKGGVDDRHTVHDGAESDDSAGSECDVGSIAAFICTLAFAAMVATMARFLDGAVKSPNAWLWPLYLFAAALLFAACLPARNGADDANARDRLPPLPRAMDQRSKALQHDESIGHASEPESFAAFGGAGAGAGAGAGDQDTQRLLGGANSDDGSQSEHGSHASSSPSPSASAPGDGGDSPIEISSVLATTRSRGARENTDGAQTSGGPGLTFRGKQQSGSSHDADSVASDAGNGGNDGDDGSGEDPDELLRPARQAEIRRALAESFGVLFPSTTRYLASGILILMFATMLAHRASRKSSSMSYFVVFLPLFVLYALVAGLSASALFCPCCSSSRTRATQKKAMGQLLMEFVPPFLVSLFVVSGLFAIPFFLERKVEGFAITLPWGLLHAFLVVMGLWDMIGVCCLPAIASASQPVAKTIH